MNFKHLLRGVRRKPPQVSPPVDLPAPQRLFVPLRQHRGPACDPVVEPGQDVLMGQIIGASEEYEAASVHSPVSGKVAALSETTDPAGRKVPCVAIDNDGQDTPIETPKEALSPLLSEDEVSQRRGRRLIKRVRQAGLVQALTLGLPLHVDLVPPKAPRSFMFQTGAPVAQPIDTLIVKCLDFDPPVCPNQSCLNQDWDDVALGVSALVRITGAERVVFAVPAGLAPPEVATQAGSRGWEVASVNAGTYPYGLHRLLIHTLTGREVPAPFGEARDVGVAIQPLITVLDLGKALRTGLPINSRVFTVAGDVKNPQTFRARLGTPISHVLEAAGGYAGEPGKVIVGGPMMGFAHYDLNTPVTKETNGLFVQSADKLQRYLSQPCIHCGRCVAACPVFLIPGELSKLCEYGKYEDAAERDLFQCIECGVCAHVCPAKRPMVQFFRLGKDELMAKRVEL